MIEYLCPATKSKQDSNGFDMVKALKAPSTKMRTFGLISSLKLVSETSMANDKHPSSIHRRNLVLSAFNLGAMALGGLTPLIAKAGTAPTRIDVHSHLIPDFYRQAMTDYNVAGDGGIPIPSWTPSAAVNFMDKFGIQTQVVSLSEPGFAFLPDLATRAQMARQINDYIRDGLINVSPASRLYRRFGGFASLPLGDPDNPSEVAAACAEAVRAINTLGLDGIGLYSSYKGIYLGDPRLDPLMRTLNELCAYVFIHPVAPPVRPDLSMPNFVLDFPFETTRAVTNMLYKSIFLRYPFIRWQAAHAGGTIPFVSYRSALLTLNLNPRSSSYSRLFYDTALSSAPPAMAAVRKVTAVSHILLGTDYPYAGIVYALKLPGDPNSELNDTFTPSERLQVDRGNALAQLPRLSKRLGLT
ncbi:amidohydrolase family protein [Aquabacterium sp.]|uniref:amidohydrolase family protein n=1 Tax=Aquabacterium sp. TaxID=1872578 RepID=UPI004037D7F3